MGNDYYYNQLKKLEELTNLSSKKQETFFQQVLIGASSILGILVALHTSQSPFLCIRLVFVFSIILLVLGILTAGITLYDYSQLVERSRQSLRIEVGKALKEERNVQPVFVNKKKRTVFCEKTSLIILIVSLFMLVLYATLQALI